MTSASCLSKKSASVVMNISGISSVYVPRLILLCTNNSIQWPNCSCQVKHREILQPWWSSLSLLPHREPFRTSYCCSSFLPSLAGQGWPITGRTLSNEPPVLFQKKGSRNEEGKKKKSREAPVKLRRLNHF